MIKVGIVGYGNLGKGVKKAVSQACDMELTGIFYPPRSCIHPASRDDTGLRSGGCRSV